MANILSFVPRATAQVSKPIVAGATAAVIIFPGVRYERKPERLPTPRVKERPLTGGSTPRR